MGQHSQQQAHQTSILALLLCSALLQDLHVVRTMSGMRRPSYVIY